MSTGTVNVTSLRLAARLARREVRRRPGRTLLVALLVAMPVAAMLVGDVIVRTNNETPIESWRSTYGEADAVINPGTTDGRLNDLIAKSRVVVGVSYLSSRVLRTTDGHRSNPEVLLFAIGDPMTRGIVQIMWGRAPKGGNEIFLTRDAARELHVGAGGTLRIARPVKQDFVVTGIGEFAEGWKRSSIVFPAGVKIPWQTEAASLSLLVDFPDAVTTATIQELIGHTAATGYGLQVSPALIATRPSQDYAAQDTERKVRWSWVIGAMVLTVAGIVIAAAFAVGARRQLVTLGQLAANGAPPEMLRRVLFLQGTWTGIVGALLGVGLGAGALAALTPYVDRLFQRDVHPYTVRLLDLVPIVLLGIVAATVAALLPARTTSRLPVLAALSGRRPLGKVPRWLPIAGACAALGGLALLGIAVVGANANAGDGPGRFELWAITAIVGGMAVLLGACAIAPAYVSVLEPAARRLQGSRRLAMRSLARQRTRTGAVVSAIAATAALAIAGSSLLLGAHAHDTEGLPYMRSDEVVLYRLGGPNGYAAPSPVAVTEARKVLPRAKATQLLVPTRPDVKWSIQKVIPDHPAKDFSPNDLGSALTPTGETFVAIADRALLANYALSKSDERLLAEHGALLIGPGDGRAEIALNGVGATPPPTRTIVAAMVGPREAVDYSGPGKPRLIVTPARAKELGMPAHRGLVTLRNPTRLTQAQRLEMLDVATEVQTVDSNGNSDLYLEVDFPQSHISPLLIESALVGLTLVLVLFVVAVNLALSAAETRDERDVLTIVGAAPRAMRETNGYKASVLTVMGAALAVPVGFLPVAVFNLSDNKNEPLVFPWFVVTVLVIVLPIVAGVVTTATSAVALRFRPVRISTMAYD